MTDEELFLEAISLSRDEREPFLASACVGSPELRRRVEQLIAAHEHSDSLLGTEALGTEALCACDQIVVEPVLPQSIGDFLILGELGRGGMGVVYKARQKSLNRIVALKVLSSGLGLSSRAILRFRREAEAAGKLHHTNIVPIYTTGEENGIHYYAMELIDGPSMDAVIRDLKQSASSSQKNNKNELPAWLKETALYESESQAAPRSKRKVPGANSDESKSSISSGKGYYDRVATMIADVAEALDHAHEHGVIHRDIKPSNLLLAPDGRLSVNDFGLARILEQPGMTMTGEFVGSPLYMSPEQISAGRTPIDHRTDIYSLGATLYEFLTLQPPFPGDSRDQVLTSILHKEPSSTRTVDRKVPIDLDTICMKALEKDPDRRYQTAGLLAEDLRRFVNRHAIGARRIGPIGRLGKLARRNPVATISILIFACVISIAMAVWQQYEVAQLERMKTEIYEAAFSGDFEDARRLLSESEGGLSQGWADLLKGQILLFEGEHEREANDLLERAAAQMPTDASARSMLAISHFLSGREDEYIRQLKTIYETPVVSFNEKLLKGYALHWFATEEAVKLLDEAIGESPNSIIAYRFRGEALTILALNERNRDVALRNLEIAEEDLNTVARLWQGNVNVTQSLVYTHLAFGLIHRELKNNRLETEHFGQASALADSLSDSFFTTEDALYSPLACHFVSNSDLQFAEFLMRNQLQLLNPNRPRQGYIEVQIPSFLFGQETIDLNTRIQFANRVHQQATPELKALTQYVPAFIAMDSPDADRAKLLRDLQLDLPSRMSKRSGIYLLLDWVALRLLDADEPTLDRVAQRIHDGYDEYFVDPHQQWGMALAEYMLREIKADELLNRLKESRSVSTYGHLAIAANLIASSDRDAARIYLQKSVDSGFYMYYAPKWSKAFLRRVDDPKWLPWFDMIEEATESEATTNAVDDEVTSGRPSLATVQEIAP